MAQARPLLALWSAVQEKTNEKEKVPDFLTRIAPRHPFINKSNHFQDILRKKKFVLLRRAVCYGISSRYTKK